MNANTLRLRQMRHNARRAARKRAIFRGEAKLAILALKSAKTPFSDFFTEKWKKLDLWTVFKKKYMPERENPELRK